jgi:hypothetical protein
LRRFSGPVKGYAKINNFGKCLTAPERYYLIADMADYQDFLKASKARRATAWKLYRRGKSMAEIGAALCVSKARAHQLIKAERLKREAT